MGKQLVLKDVRVDHFNVFEPVKNKENGRMQRSVRLILDADHPQVAQIAEMTKQIIAERWPDKKTRPSSIRKPLRTYDDEFKAQTAEAKENDAEPPKLKAHMVGKMFFNATSYEENAQKFGNVPRVFSPSKQIVTDKNFIKNGDYVNVILDMYAYPGPGKEAANCGVTFSLGDVQFKRAGEALASNQGVNGESAFGVEEEPENTISGE